MKTDYNSSDSAIHELDRLGIKYSEVEQPHSVDELQDIVRKAVKNDLHIFPIGGGTSLGMADIPDQIDILLDMRGLDKVLHFDDKNLNITLQAGMTINEIHSFLSSQGRGYMLPLDPMYSELATIGGAYAANSSGPLRHFYGTLRDQALGAGAIDAQGRKVKFGGMTVKNVSGYDLTKFFIGSFGSLCIISQISLRILPFPQSFSACEVALPTEEETANFLYALRQSYLLPSGVVLFQDRLQDAPRIIVAFEGHEKAVERQNNEIHQLSQTHGGTCSTSMGRENMVQSLHKAFDPVPGHDPVAIFKIAVPIGQGTQTFNRVVDFTQGKDLEAKCTLLAGNGVIHIHLMSADEEKIGAYAQDLKQAISGDTAQFMPLKAPASIARNLRSRSDEKLSNYLLKPLKNKFDPQNILPSLGE